MTELETKLINAAKQEKLLGSLSEARLEEKHSPEEIGNALVRINNDHGIDVIGQFQKLGNANASHQFFVLRQLLVPALAEINCPVEKVMRCVLHLTAEAGQDMSAGWLIAPFIDFCCMSSERPGQALNLILNSKELQDLLSPALVAGSRLTLMVYHDRAIELTQDADIDFRTRAIYSLGQLQYDEDPSLIEKSVTVLKDVVIRETDDSLLGNSVIAALNLYLLNKELANEFIDIVSKALESGADNALHAASELLAFHANDLPAKILPLLSEHLAKVSPNSGGTIQNIDFGLQAPTKLDDPIEGIRLLEELLKANDGATRIDALASIRTTLAQSDGLLNKLATRWFMSGNQYLGRAIGNIIEHESADMPSLVVDPDELPNTDFAHIYFVARKAIGFLFICPVAAASFILSLIELKPDRKIQDALTKLLFNPLMLNYPGALKKAFEPNLSDKLNDPATTPCRTVSERIETYLADIKAIGEILEHRPPQSHQEFHIRHFTREMSDAMKKAEVNSVLLSIVKKSVLLYGRKWIT